MDIKNPFKQGEIETKLDEEVTALLDELAKMDKTDDKYATVVEQLSKLYELRNSRKISNDTLATIGANLAGIVILMTHERTHVIASKAFSLLRKVL